MSVRRQALCLFSIESELNKELMFCYIALVLLFFVYCKSFNVLDRALSFPRGRKTLQSYRLFLNLQNFQQLFFRGSLRNRLPGLPCQCLRRNLRSRKRVQSYTLFLIPPNFSATFFVAASALFRIALSNPLSHSKINKC